jgi:hypothetical protein
VQRSSLPQHVCPACRVACLLDTKGAEINLSTDELPQCGQEMIVPARTSTSNVPSQLQQRYS